MKVLMMSHLKLSGSLLLGRRAVLMITHLRSLVMKKRMRLQRLQIRMAYIEFTDSDAMNKALELNNSQIGNNTLYVDDAKPRGDSRGGGGGGERGGRFGGRGAGCFGRGRGRFGLSRGVWF
nr:nucleolin 1 [Ipomoea batatas]